MTIHLFPNLNLPHDGVVIDGRNNRGSEMLDANNTMAMVYFRDRGYRGSIAKQVAEHITIASHNPRFLLDKNGVY